jgi:hypothetical protein
MTITITKAKLTLWIITAFILFCAPAQALDMPHAAAAAVAYREFMADFTGYDDYSLIDVCQLKTGFYGVVMLCPVGFYETLVFDCRDGKREIVYRDVYIPKKETREKLRQESIRAADARKLAKSAAARPE